MSELTRVIQGLDKTKENAEIGASHTERAKRFVETIDPEEGLQALEFLLAYCRGARGVLKAAQEDSTKATASYDAATQWASNAIGNDPDPSQKNTQIFLAADNLKWHAETNGEIQSLAVQEASVAIEALEGLKPHLDHLVKARESLVTSFDDQLTGAKTMYGNAGILSSNLSSGVETPLD